MRGVLFLALGGIFVAGGSAIGEETGTVHETQKRIDYITIHLDHLMLSSVGPEITGFGLNDEGVQTEYEYPVHTEEQVSLDKLRDELRGCSFERSPVLELIPDFIEEAGVSHRMCDEVIDSAVTNGISPRQIKEIAHWDVINWWFVGEWSHEHPAEPKKPKRRREKPRVM